MTQRITITRPNRRRNMPSGGRSVTIQGERVYITDAKFRFICWMCESELIIKNQGLKCSLNEYHYGQILKEKAQKLTRGELNMSMATLFENTTGLMREIDMDPNGFVATIKLVTQETRNKFGTRDKEKIVCLSLDGQPLKVRISYSYGMKLLKAWGDPGDSGDTNGAWVGKSIRVFLNFEKNGKNSGNVVRVAPSQQETNTSPPKAKANTKAKKIRKLIHPKELLTHLMKKIAETPILDSATGEPLPAKLHPLGEYTPKLVERKLLEALGGDVDKMHSVLEHFNNAKTVDDLTAAHADAMLDWLLNGGKSDKFNAPVIAPAPAEAELLVAWVVEVAA